MPLLMFSLNNLNEFQQGIILVAVGLFTSLYFIRAHRNYTHDGFKPFVPFRREGKTKIEDNMFAMLYYRSYFGKFLGFLLIAIGINLILKYFNLPFIDIWEPQ